MICKKCGVENEEWQMRCTKCGTLLKKIKFNNNTNVFCILCLLVDVALIWLNIYGLCLNFNNLKMQFKIYSFIIIIMLIIAAAGIFGLRIFKRKLAIIINILATCIASFFVGFSSPMMMIIFLLPSILILISILSKWSDMDF